MLDQRPYLIRSTHEWITDSNCTPYIHVDCSVENISIPSNIINDDNTVVLDISYKAVNNLLIDDSGISFSATFGGIIKEIFLPTDAIISMVARETSAGIMLPRPSKVEKKQEKEKIDTRPKLELVKKNKK